MTPNCTCSVTHTACGNIKCLISLCKQDRAIWNSKTLREIWMGISEESLLNTVMTIATNPDGHYRCTRMLAGAPVELPQICLEQQHVHELQAGCSPASPFTKWKFLPF